MRYSLVCRKYIHSVADSQLKRKKNKKTALAHSALHVLFCRYWSNFVTFKAIISYILLILCRGGVLEDTFRSPWPRPRSFQVLENALSWAEDSTIFWLAKSRPGSWPFFFFVLKNPRGLAENWQRPFFCWRTLESSQKFCNLFVRRPFFWRTLARCVLSPWPWAFLFLASRGLSLEGRCLASDVFLWPRLQLCSCVDKSSKSN